MTMVWSKAQSQRDCVIQPRVARNELPWAGPTDFHQPQRGCGGFCFWCRLCVREGRNPFRNDPFDYGERNW